MLDMISKSKLLHLTGAWKAKPYFRMSWMFVALLCNDLIIRMKTNKNDNVVFNSTAINEWEAHLNALFNDLSSFPGIFSFLLTYILAFSTFPPCDPSFHSSFPCPVSASCLVCPTPAKTCSRIYVSLISLSYELLPALLQPSWSQKQTNPPCPLRGVISCSVPKLKSNTLSRECRLI